MIASLLLVLAKCESPSSTSNQVKRAVLPGYPNKFLPLKSKAGGHAPLRMIMIQFRNGERPPQNLRGGTPMKLNRIVRPSLKIINQPIKYNQYQTSKRPPIFYKQPQQQQKPFNFYSSPQGPNTGEYVYEKPEIQYVQPQQLQLQQQQQQPQIIQHQPIHNVQQQPFKMNYDTHFSPIHTIAAPNLGSQKLQSFPDLSSSNFDNHISLTDGDAYAGFHPSTTRPFQFNQYQVTEDPSNDHTIHDLFSGAQKLYAPDPDPSLPTHGVRFSTDPFSRPSNGNPLPSDVAAAASLRNQMYQIVNVPFPQQQLADTYALPITGQPQLQQHLMQQAAMNQVM